MQHKAQTELTCSCRSFASAHNLSVPIRECGGRVSHKEHGGIFFFFTATKRQEQHKGDLANEATSKTNQEVCRPQSLAFGKYTRILLEIQTDLMTLNKWTSPAPARRRQSQHSNQRALSTNQIKVSHLAGNFPFRL